MSETKDTGGPAFPETQWNDMTRQMVQWGGMTLRDYFAGQAMQGFRAAESDADYAPITDISMAESAYAQADAMLEVRAKP